IVHSMVTFVDGSVKAQLGLPDMRLPISLALAYPDRLAGVVPALEIAHLGELDFLPLDSARFPAPSLARAAARAGAPFPAVLNAVNEEAVAAFLSSRIAFSGIVSAVESALDRYKGGGSTLEDVIAADAWGREYFRSMVGKVSG
ncbi:MAG: 1-deoxy-D-xylulose-5-phosphate reductoisomerase, partial [Candidatus Dormibacteraeota bacterium]|nr:1-deoxy-D-xylulose-5-phosphate reductoisomerase [Candidatus Dormibacteraeota bacterium]